MEKFLLQLFKDDFIDFLSKQNKRRENDVIKRIITKSE